jgi:multiple sugar transport system ATP-binding protein
MNLVTVPLGANGAVALGGIDVPIPAPARQAATAGGWTEIVLGLRPEALELAADGIPAEVEVVEEIGADAHVFCVAELGGERTKLTARTGSRDAPPRGSRVNLRPKGDEAHLFDPRSGARLG